MSIILVEPGKTSILQHKHFANELLFINAIQDLRESKYVDPYPQEVWFAPKCTAKDVACAMVYFNLQCWPGMSSRDRWITVGTRGITEGYTVLWRIENEYVHEEYHLGQESIFKMELLPKVKARYDNIWVELSHFMCCIHIVQAYYGKHYILNRPNHYRNELMKRQRQKPDYKCENSS